MIYFIVFILLLILSLRYDINGKTRGRDQWYKAMLVIFILIAGLRWRLGSDTPAYIDSYFNDTEPLDEISFSELSFGGKPLWQLLNSFVKMCGGHFYIVQLIHAFFVNTLLFIYFKRHSLYIFTCLFFYFIHGFTNMNMEEMKASMSIVVFLFANDFFLEGKKIKACTLYLVAILFHSQAIILLITPFLMSIRLNRKGILLMIGAFIVGYTLQIMLGTYLDLIEIVGNDEILNKATSYSSIDQYMNANPSLIGKMVREIPYIVYPILCLLFVKIKYHDINIIKLEPLILIGVIFVILQTNVRIFYRYHECFNIYFIIIFAHVLVSMTKQKGRLNLSYSIRAVRTFVVFSPLILSMLLLYTKDNVYVRYYPYSSVIEKSLDKDRESFYDSWLRPAPKVSEY